MFLAAFCIVGVQNKCEVMASHIIIELVWVESDHGIGIAKLMYILEVASLSVIEFTQRIKRPSQAQHRTSV